MPTTSAINLISFKARSAAAASRPVVVEPLTARSAPDWDDYVASRPDATLYHLRAWKGVAERAYEMEAPFLLARSGPDGRVCGVLPLIRIPRPFSPILASGLFGHYGPLLADVPEAGRALVNAACRLADEGLGRLVHLKLLGEPPDWLQLPTRAIWATMTLDLRGGHGALWDRLKSPLRTQIRRARQNGLSPASGRGQLEAFYDVLEENMSRKGSPMYGRTFFHSLLQELWPHCDFITLQHQGRTVSGALIAWFNGTMYVPFASSRPAAFKLRPNELLWWEIMNRACQLGLHTLDFGSSLRDSSGLEFKSKWGAEEMPVSSALYSPTGSIPTLEPADSRLLQTVVKIWARMPRAIVGAIGPSVIRWVA